MAKRYRIIGVEVVGLGAFLLLITLLQMVESSWNASVAQFSIVDAIVGITIVLVGLETLSLNGKLPPDGGARGFTGYAQVTLTSLF